MCCRNLPGPANPPYLSRFPYSSLPCVARIALPVVSEWYQKFVDHATLVPVRSIGVGRNEDGLPATGRVQGQAAKPPRSLPIAYAHTVRASTQVIKL
jgi:hypothetical protein